MMLPPDFHSDLELQALAEEKRQRALADGPQARRNDISAVMLGLVIIFTVFVMGSAIFYAIGGWWGVAFFVFVIWLGPTAAWLLYELWTAPVIN